MPKTIRAVVLGALVMTAGAATAAAPKGFSEDFDAAAKTAAATDRPMLVVFSGSDWCYWCQKLEREYLSQPDFVPAVTDTFVLAFVDMPRQANLIPAKARKRNPELLERYGIEAFPTLKIIDAQGKVLADVRSGRGESVADYVAYLKRMAPPKFDNRAIAALFESEDAVAALLAQTRAKAGVPPAVAKRIAAVSERVMCRDCPKAPHNRWRWTAAMLNELERRDTSAQTQFLLGQLQKCGHAEEAARVRAFAAKAGNAAVSERAKAVAKALSSRRD